MNYMQRIIAAQTFALLSNCSAQSAHGPGNSIQGDNDVPGGNLIGGSAGGAIRTALATVLALLLVMLWASAAGAQNIRCPQPNSIVQGTARTDVLLAHPLGCTLLGAGGNDKLIGSRGNDVVVGDGLRFPPPVRNGQLPIWRTGADLVHGGDGNDRLYGDAQIFCQLIPPPEGEGTVIPFDFFCPARIRAPDIFRFFADDGIDEIMDLDEFDTIVFARPKQQVMFGHYASRGFNPDGPVVTDFALQMERTTIKIAFGAGMPHLYAAIRGPRYLSLPVFESDDGYRDRFATLGSFGFEEFGDADRIIRVTPRDIGQTITYRRGDDIDFGPMTTGTFRILVRAEGETTAVYRVLRRGNVIRFVDRQPVRFVSDDTLLTEFHWHNARVHTEALLDLASVRRAKLLVEQ